MRRSDLVDREEIHQRDVICRGYRRNDGLWDIEGRLTDRKTYGFDNSWRGHIEAGKPVHEMWVRLTVDDGFTIRDVVLESEKTPLPACASITPDYAALIGLRIGPGFSGQLRDRLGGASGCTHLTKLVSDLATVAIQTIGPLRTPGKSKQPDRKPPHIDGCHALRSDSDAVREHYPKWYRGE